MRYLIKTFLCESIYLNTFIYPQQVIEYEKGRGRFCYNYTRPYTLRLMDTKYTLYDDIYRSQEQDCVIEDMII